MKVIIQNLAISYQDHGSGDVMLFLHGWGNDSHSFDSLASHFSKTYRVIQLDLPGFGDSEPPHSSWKIEDYALFVEKFCQKLSLTLGVLVGHSFGGRISIKGVGKTILFPKKVVLIGAAGIAKSRSSRNLFLNVVAKVGKCVMCIPPLYFWRDQLRRRFYKKIGSDYLDAGRLKHIYLNTISEDLCEDAKKMTVPTQLIWGRHDTATPVEDGQKFASLIQNSKWKVFDDAGHFVHQEKTKEVALVMEEFLK